MNLAEHTRDTAEEATLDTRKGQKSDSAYRTISEVASELDLPQHVLRFWESKFKQISPLKRGGGRRYYRPQDVDLIKRIHYLLHTQGYTIKGVQKLLTKDRLLQQSVPFIDSETASIQMDGLLPHHPAHDTDEDDRDILSNGMSEAAQTTVSSSHAAANGVTHSAMPLAMRTDLQLILNRLKKLRAQAAKR